jgi:DNA primase
MTSKGAREASLRAYGSLENLCRQKHAKLLLDIHLDPNHQAFMLFEAPTAEVVRDILAESGLIAFLDLTMHLVTPIPELLKMAEKIPTIYP